MSVQSKNDSPEEILKRIREVLEDATDRIGRDPDFVKRTLANWEKGALIC